MRSCRYLTLYFALAGILYGQGAGLPVKAIAASSGSVAVASDGTVWEWGVKSSVAARVPGLSGVTVVASGFTQALAAKDDGTVWAWPPGGRPSQVGGLTGVAALAIAGDPSGDHALALKGDGTVWSWGETSAYRSEPSLPGQVANLNGIISIAAGPDYDLVVKSDGTVWQWGRQYGGMAIWVAAPAQVSGLNGVRAVSTAGPTGIAVKTDGTVWEWPASNSGAAGQTGAKPAQVSGLSNVISIAGSTGLGHRLALKRDGTVWAWGQNRYGQSGNGTVSDSYYDSSPPAQVDGLGSVTEIAAGNVHCMALQSDGTLWVWGGDTSGQLGVGAVLQRSYPMQIRGLGGVNKLAAGVQLSLALKDDGTVWQWGAPNISSQVDSSAATQVSDLSDVQAIAVGWQYLAVKRDGTVWQWPTSQPTPTQIVGLSDVVATNASGQVIAKRDGTVWLLMGYPPAPVQVQGLDRIKAVASYDPYYLALRDDGTVWQWGMYYDFWSDTVTTQPPERIYGLSDVTAIAGGDIATALRRDGTVWEWSGRATPGRQIGLNNVTAIAVGSAFSMALKRDGTVWAWGRNDNGQLGDGTSTDRDAPVQVAGLIDVKAIAAGTAHALAVTRNGAVWAWGNNLQGQLGDARITVRPTPIRAIPPGAPDLTITSSHERDFSVGVQAVYTLTVTNIGRMPTGSGMTTITDMLPPGLTWSGATGNDWGCSAAGQIVTCASPVRIQPGASTAVGLVVDVDSAAVPGVTNLALVSNESDSDACNNGVGDPTVVLQPADPPAR